VGAGLTVSRMLKRRLLAAAFAVATLLGFGGHPFFGRTVAAALDVSAAEGQLVELLNTDRAAAGLPPLQADPKLMDVARWRSEDMVARAYFGHDIGGFTIARLLRERQIPFKLAGENIVSNTFEDGITVGLAQTELMKSASHRDNVLRADYNLVGVGIAVGPDRRTVFTQVFVQSVPPTPTPQPTAQSTLQGTPGAQGTGTAATPRVGTGTAATATSTTPTLAAPATSQVATPQAPPPAATATSATTAPALSFAPTQVPLPVEPPVAGPAGSVLPG
jgi:uncharacterized protein YkwD